MPSLPLSARLHLVQTADASYTGRFALRRHGRRRTMAERDTRIDRLLLGQEIADFLYREAELLDERRYREWLDLLADDVRYWMPIRRNVKLGDDESEFTRANSDINWFDEGKETLRRRVKQIETGIHWAEEPRSRLSHLVTNVQVQGAEPSLAAAQEVSVTSRFLIYRNRVETETDILVGRREDQLRRNGAGWLLARRKIILDQNVLLSKNLTFFI
jgi:3-phenylpropionate/cinnamic acid dioxygenase small subunit